MCVLPLFGCVRHVNVVALWFFSEEYLRMY